MRPSRPAWALRRVLATVLLLDKPLLGLAPKVVRQIFALIAGIRTEGTSILLVEQNVHGALEVADHGHVMAGGRIVLEAAAATLREDPPDLSDYAEILPLWQKDDGITIQWVEQSATTLAFNVTRCRYAQSYREIGPSDLGDTLSCNRDGEFCHGYKLAMKSERTQTIMRGAAFCDFRYTLPAADDKA